MMAAESSATDNHPADEHLETLAFDSSSPAPAAASTDPLLHPPPSPSSTSPAAANHDAFVHEDDGEADFVPVLPTPDAPAIPREPSPEFYQITVSDPRKHEEAATGAAGVIPGSGTYFSYLVTTRIADGGGRFCVRRRFRDVVALADRLRATHRGLFVPARPEKSIVEGHVMQRHDFVNQRCVLLQRYLCRVAAHPTVGRSADFHTFLTEPSGIPTSEGESPRYNPATAAAMPTAVTTPTTPAKGGGRDFFGMFKDLKQTVTNGLMAVRPPPVEEETDAKFLAHKAKLEELQQQLTATSLQADSLVKAREDLKTCTAHLGMTFLKLAKFEKDQSTCSSQRSRAADISHFASAAVKVSRCQGRLDAEIVKHLDTIRKYLETMTSVHNAFTDRSNALLNIQNLSSDLFTLHSRVAKLESVSSRGIDQERSRYLKVAELKDTIRTAEDAKSHARKEYDLIKENNMNEIKRFNKEIRQDLVEMMKGFVTNQVEYSDQIASIWAKLAEETKVYADRRS
ncbi:hypothetical protein QYE76_055782 [Lolium multiflorum]|uniref:PX domain-containing protein n=1 Tax=Lolium multiflorum TaxID=4521 RepID=A0AAD8T214_LOLMU|nr:hypothetical protein QYE76_055782 [Lolium multiflorum]